MSLAIESLGQTLHQWAQGTQSLKTFSEKRIGWLVAEAPPSDLEATHDPTHEFKRRLKKIRRACMRRKRERFAWLMGMVRLLLENGRV